MRLQDRREKHRSFEKDAEYKIKKSKTSEG